VRSDRETVDDHVPHPGEVERFHHALGLKALLSAHGGEARWRSASVARETSIVRRRHSAGESERCSAINSASFHVRAASSSVI